MAKQIIGYFLILLGLIIVFASLFASYQVFTGTRAVPEIFKTSEKADSKNNASSIEKQIEETVQKQISQILPSDSVTRLLNLISWSILAGILLLGGGQVAGIGVKLIVVKNNI